ncbi:MAG: DUF3168 domain-containing protein [Hyphomicrobiaceae bacterium]|jgi:hypothetical protein|nr:DUF3168 domain-containing protein [Hyphomicrobiaceae bacterium]MDX2448855.1 DUF3168 domain-containing protein [Hyphomicrobiaceae bacterium]
MTAASWALQRNIYQALRNSSELTSLLGGDRIYSQAPPAAQFPFITLGQTVNLDWSTGTDEGAEHSLTLHVWSRADGAREVHEILEMIRTVLHDQLLALEDHYLVNLRHEFMEARLDPDGETMHGIVRYRAVTEPMQQVAA